MVNKVYILLLNLIILLNNFVNSQAIKCDINQSNSCFGVNSFYGEIYQEKFICHKWVNEDETICIPKSLISECNSNNDCEKGYECILNQCNLSVKSNKKYKRAASILESDLFIFMLCIAIPLIFVGIVITLVSYAKKAYDRAELKKAQNTNASSLSSMNLYSSKNYLYSHSRSTNNGSSNRSVVNFENSNNQMMDHYNYNNNNFNNFNNMNNFNSSPSYNTGTGINGTQNLGSIANGGLDNQETNNLDFNTQLLLSKNYRMQGFGTSSLQRMNTNSPKLNVPPLFALKDQQNNTSSQYPMENLDGTTAAMSEVSTKESSIKNYTPMSPYSNHRSELPPIPVANKLNRDDDDKSSATYFNQKYKNDSEVSYNSKSTKNKKYNNFDKSYNEVKRDKQRISVSPPLKDWNDSYITVQDDKKNKADSSNKKKENKNKDYYGKDIISQPKYPTPTYKSPDKAIHGAYNDYIMALSPKKSHATEIIDQYVDYSADNEDITMKNMSVSTTSSLTYVPEKVTYNNMPYNYSKKYYN